ncbi:MAG: hypothetical protein ACJ8GN_09825 [Longimicrobiaceae bacterium]
MNNLSRREFLGMAGAGALGGFMGGPAVEDLLDWSARSRLVMRAQGLPSRIYLAGINWIREQPRGVRLRWYSPLTIPGSPDFAGFPTRFLVQRAPVYFDQMFPDPTTPIHVGSRPRCPHPMHWWSRGIQMTSVAPAVFKPAAPSVHAVSFVYQGPATICEIRNSAQCALAQVAIEDGQRLYFEGADIASVAFLADTPVSLREDRYLNLFTEFDLGWQPIAKIAVRDPVVDQTSGAYDHIISRMYDSPTITEVEWDAIRQHAVKADGIKTPADEEQDTKMPTWETWFALTTIRWEIATLSGYGFIDGPQRTPRVVGDEMFSATDDVPTVHRAYRVIADPDAFNFGYSNVALICPGEASTLLPPTEAEYGDARVRLVQQVDDFDPTQPSHPVFAGSARLQWRHQDPWALGVRAEEAISTSPSKPGLPGSSSDTQLAATRHERLDFVGDVRREFSVPFPDSKLSARLVSIDGWDRESPPVDISETPLQFDHAPAPPPLACAVRDRDAQTVQIERLVTGASAPPDCLEMTAAYPEWVPDEVVATRGGQLEIARRIRPPRALDVMIARVVSFKRPEYIVTLQDPLGPGNFSGGTLVQGNVEGAIVEVSADRRTLSIALDGQAAFGSSAQGTPGEPGCPSSQQPTMTTPVFTNSAARVVEDPLEPALWNRLTSASNINALPAVFSFTDTMPSSGPIEICVYAARVGFNGFDGVRAYGPYGNPVTALDKQAPPTQPPPFDVQILGRDYYGRLALAVRFNQAVNPTTTFVAAWAKGIAGDWAEGGDATKKSFAANGTVGILGKQQVHRQRQLFELIEAPNPHFIDMPLTIGIKEVDAIGQESEYRLAELLIPAT